LFLLLHWEKKKYLVTSNQQQALMDQRFYTLACQRHCWCDGSDPAQQEPSRESNKAANQRSSNSFKQLDHNHALTPNVIRSTAAIGCETINQFDRFSTYFSTYFRSWPPPPILFNHRSHCGKPVTVSVSASRLAARDTAIMKASWPERRERERERAIANMVQSATRCVVVVAFFCRLI
jgi:hypothetical protein